tara:strand:+ start:43 stop:417 length:375 start_codon:yes stop_codon:yes gene_type:complete
LTIRRKVSHYRRIIKRNSSRVSSINIGDIVSFNYRGSDIYDKTPLVFVLEKSTKSISGINLNYMKEYKVQTLLKESNFKKMKRYDMYKDSFRTYFKNKITMVDKIEYKTDEMLKDERRRKIIEN